MDNYNNNYEYRKENIQQNERKSKEYSDLNEINEAQDSNELLNESSNELLNESSNDSSNEINQSDYMEIDLKDMIRVFMEQNAQFEFLNKFYDSTESQNTETETEISSIELINEYYIFIWKNITDQNMTFISIAKNIESAIQQLKCRFFTTVQQSKSKKTTFCNLNDVNYLQFMNQIKTQKYFMFPCKNFSCFYK
jgi:hypothetical protein